LMGEVSIEGFLSVIEEIRFECENKVVGQENVAGVRMHLVTDRRRQEDQRGLSPSFSKG